MQLDFGLVIVIAATLIFYLRLIVFQRQRVKRLSQDKSSVAKPSSKKKKAASQPSPDLDVFASRSVGKRVPTLAKESPRLRGPRNATGYSSRYSVLSSDRRDWIIAGIGLLAIIAGVLLNRSLLFPTLQSWWWMPLALGIVLFSWAFKLK